MSWAVQCRWGGAGALYSIVTLLAVLIAELISEDGTAPVSVDIAEGTAT